MDTTVVAAASGFLLWVLVAITYLHLLRGALAERQRGLRATVGALAAALRSWQDGLGEATSRDWRESAVAVGQVTAELESITDPLVPGELVAVDEARLVLEEAEKLVSGAGGAADAGAQGRVRAARRAMDHLDADLRRYNAAASDVAFACERIPLSLLAALVGLHARPLLVTRTKGKAPIGRDADGG